MFKYTIEFDNWIGDDKFYIDMKRTLDFVIKSILTEDISNRKMYVFTKYKLTDDQNEIINTGYFKKLHSGYKFHIKTEDTNIDDIEVKVISLTDEEEITGIYKDVIRFNDDLDSNIKETYISKLERDYISYLEKNIDKIRSIKYDIQSYNSIQEYITLYGVYMNKKDFKKEYKYFIDYCKQNNFKVKMINKNVIVDINLFKNKKENKIIEFFKTLLCKGNYGYI